MVIKANLIAIYFERRRALQSSILSTDRVGARETLSLLAREFSFHLADAVSLLEFRNATRDDDEQNPYQS